LISGQSGIGPVNIGLVSITSDQQLIEQLSELVIDRQLIIVAVIFYPIDLFDYLIKHNIFTFRPLITD